MQVKALDVTQHWQQVQTAREVMGGCAPSGGRYDAVSVS